MTPKQITITTALAYLGKPYLWGGDDPLAGFDCSGLIVECLKSAGRLPRNGDWTAEQLYGKFPNVADPAEGCLVFWVNMSGKIIHVELCLDDVFSIGASGGGSETLTEADAVRQNAYIKIRPIRPGAFGYVDPFAV